MDNLSIHRLVGYLIHLAPDYFGAGIEPATEADLTRLEAAAGRPIVGYHRAFLLAMGNTKPGAVDPFLNGRVFNIDELIRAYPDIEGFGLTLAPEISVFSAPESFGDFEFIRTNNATLEQEIGQLDFATGQFTPEAIGSLENYLYDFAFTFRIGQLDHVRTFLPRKEWNPASARRALEHRGMLPVFRFPNGVECYEGGPWAAVLFHDGSGYIASDDRVALLDVCGTLEDLADMEIKPSPRLAAPKH